MKHVASYRDDLPSDRRQARVHASGVGTVDGRRLCGRERDDHDQQYATRGRGGRHRAADRLNVKNDYSTGRGNLKRRSAVRRSRATMIVRYDGRTALVRPRTNVHNIHVADRLLYL